MKNLTRRISAVAPAARVRSTARLEARIPSELKEIIEAAATVAGHASVTDYIVQTLRVNASSIVEMSRRSRLDADESRAFVQSLLAPAEPAPALVAAFAHYREQVR
jgi:uncharacterized protein (DUF1778 family)